ncbi:hypothetical protein D3C76_455430 [compost metagenome]
MAGAVVLVVEGGEAPGLQAPVWQVGVVQEPAGGVFRMQAFVAGVEHRGFHGHFAVAQLGVAQAQFECGAGAGVVGLGAAIAVARQQAGAGMAAAAVQLEAEKTMGIDADAECALGEAGADFANETLGPFLAVVLATAGGRAEVAVQEVVAAEQRPAGLFGLAERRAQGEGGEQGAAWSVSGADHEGSGRDDPGMWMKDRPGVLYVCALAGFACAGLFAGKPAPTGTAQALELVVTCSHRYCTSLGASGDLLSQVLHRPWS